MTIPRLIDCPAHGRFSLTDGRTTCPACALGPLSGENQQLRAEIERLRAEVEALHGAISTAVADLLIGRTEYAADNLRRILEKTALATGRGDGQSESV